MVFVRKADAVEAVKQYNGVQVMGGQAARDRQHTGLPGCAHRGLGTATQLDGRVLAIEFAPAGDVVARLSSGLRYVWPHRVLACTMQRGIKAPSRIGLLLG